MNQIVIEFETDNHISAEYFSISLNKHPVDFRLEQNKFVIDTEVPIGINLLAIRLLSEETNFLLKVKNFILDKVSSRQTLYLTFTQKNNLNTCTTWLSNIDPEIIIPFGNPLSWWLSECAKKIPNTFYGTNLYDNFNIFYPETIEIDSKFPKLLRDFMQYNLGFHAYPKSELKTPMHNRKIPYLRVSIDYDEQLLLDEFTQNVDLLDSNYYKPKQNEYNNQEVESLDLWRVAMAVPTVESDNWKQNILYEQKDFPLLFDLLERITAIGGVRIVHAFIGQVTPYSYVAPHADDFYQRDPRYTNTDGCAQFFIPIGWKSGNYFKFSDVGLIPYDQGALLVNNSEFMHGSVNASGTTRFTIGILCEFTNDNILSLLPETEY